MGEEDKQLLLVDLCGRLPYGVMIQHPDLFISSTIIIEKLSSIDNGHINDIGIDIEYVKPYLRPMSSMTGEEMSELRQYGCLCMNLDGSVQDIGVYGAIHSIPVIDWCNKYHLDYRGLIEKGLALEAPKGMYNIK